MGRTVDEAIIEAGAWLSEALRLAADGSRVDDVSVRRIRALVDQAERACDTLLQQFVATGEHLLDGAPNPSAWLTAQTHAPKTEATSRLRRHELLGALSSFNEALEDGKIGPAHVRAVALAANPTRLQYLIRDEQILLDSALQLNPARFGLVVRRWTALCDDELSDPPRRTRSNSVGTFT